MSRRAGIAALLLASTVFPAPSHAADSKVIFRATAHSDSDSFDPATAFSFEPATNVLLRDVVVSKPAKFTGSRKGSPISVTSTQYRICAASDCSDRGATGWTVAPGTVVDGQYIQLKADAPTREAQTVEATVTVAAASARFSVSTRTAKPTVGTFPSLSGQTAGNVVTSAQAVVSGYAVAPVAADAGSTVEVCADDGGCSSFAQTGTATDADLVRLRTTAPAAGTSKTVTFSVDGGYVGATWTVSSAVVSCTTPWNATVANGSSTTAYSATSVAWDASCTTVAETRTCSNGTLSGSFTNQNCAPATARSCTTPWSATVAHGSSVFAYTAASAADCSTVRQTRTCTDGTLSGSATIQNCTASIAGNTAIVSGPDGVKVRCESWSGTTCQSAIMNVDNAGWGFINGQAPGGVSDTWCSFMKGTASTAKSLTQIQTASGYGKSFYTTGTFIKNTTYGPLYSYDMYAGYPYKAVLVCN